MKAPQDLIREAFDLIPINGIYEQDLLRKLVNEWSQRSIEAALAHMVERKLIKKAGGPVRPIYVRMESAKVFYTNIKPATGERSLLAMHANFEERPT